MQNVLQVFGSSLCSAQPQIFRLEYCNQHDQYSNSKRYYVLNMELDFYCSIKDNFLRIGDQNLEVLPYLMYRVHSGLQQKMFGNKSAELELDSPWRRSNNCVSARIRCLNDDVQANTSIVSVYINFSISRCHSMTNSSCLQHLQFS